MRKSLREKRKNRREKKNATRRNYRDTLFVSIFGRSKGAKEYFLSLYNAIHGTDLKLSDAFKDVKTEGLLPESLQLDLTVKVFNINKSANHPILHKCEAMLGYSNFTEYVRIGKKNGEKNPIAYALSESRRNGILTEYFAHLSKEEQSMIFGE